MVICFFTGPDNITYGYFYDANNQLTGIQIPNVGIFTVNDYKWNRPAAETLPGGGKRQYDYDPLMRLTNITAKDPGSNDLLQYQYTYDKVDNITAKQTEHGAYTYTYDELYRLTDTETPEADETFTYDNVGNRLTTEDTAGQWSHNANNELEGYDNTSFQYDANGNMTEKNVDGVITKFFYNLEDRLERVEDNSGNIIATYYYDPFGRRLSKEVNGTRTYFHYSDEGLIGEYNAAGAEIKSYGWKPGSTWGTDPVFMKVGGEYYFYHNDHLGTPQMMTTSSGAVVWSAKYTSFGKANVDPGSVVVNPLRFPGQYEDIESGLLYNYFRFYDPLVGRYLRNDSLSLSKVILVRQSSLDHLADLFITNQIDEDEIEFAFLSELLYQYALRYPELNNYYLYLFNSPLMYIDPYGLDWLQNLSDFSAAFGDTITFGLTKWVRRKLGSDHVVDYCSGYYTGGKYAGYAWELAMGAELLRGFRWMKNAKGFEKAWSKDFRTGWHRLPKGKYPGAGWNLPHYHRRPGIGKHRPWQGGW